MAEPVGFWCCNHCGATRPATRGLNDGPCHECGTRGACLSDTELGAQQAQSQFRQWVNEKEPDS